MGGYGSGRPREKEPVEDCIVLPAGVFQRKKLVGEGVLNIGSLGWVKTASGKQVSSIGFVVCTLGGARVLSLSYAITSTGEKIDLPVGLTVTPLPWGGVRWDFVCPERDCGRVCRKLYLPPGNRNFACRLCHHLTYASAQKAHKFDRLYRLIGITPAQAKALWG